MPRSTRTDRLTIERFRPRYGVQATAVERAIERAAIGDNVGASGYTTVAQARRLARLLRLAPGALLLDVGCGRGYPGWYMAREAGCRVVGADLPIASLRQAVGRARRQGLARRAAFVAASATALPFRPHSFDAITHTDVLC